MPGMREAAYAMHHSTSPSTKVPRYLRRRFGYFMRANLREASSLPAWRLVLVGRPVLHDLIDDDGADAIGSFDGGGEAGVARVLLEEVRGGTAARRLDREVAAGAHDHDPILVHATGGCEIRERLEGAGVFHRRSHEV